MQSKHGLTELILVMGAPGAGKSTAWLSIAELHQKMGSPSRFHVLDSDQAMPRMLAEGYRQLTNVTTYPVFTWDEYVKALATALKGITPRDWLVVDMLDPSWDAVQSYYIEQIFHEDPGQFFLEARKAIKGKSLQALDGWQDWTVINRLYKGWINQLIFQSRCHVFATAKVAAIDAKTADKETLQVFGPYGVKPKGQKDAAYLFHTVLLLAQGAQGGKWVGNTIKDRTRPRWEGQTITNFGVQYLVQVAGWSLR